MNRSDLGEGSLAVIGNPPFGVRSDLAKRFIKHAVELNAETIAFILPSTFSKALNQRESLFPSDYRLVLEEPLPESSFTLEGEDFHIPCVWYVWTRGSDFLKGKNLRKAILEEHEDFSFLPRGDKSADFAINGNNGKIKELSEISNPKAEHYIRVNDREKVNEVRNTLSNIKYVFNSSVNGGVAWIGKQEILAAYSQR